MKVVYFQKDLSNMFLRPKSWQEGTQLRREEAKAKMKREKQFLSDLTQSPAKKRSNLSKMLADELEKSKAFDEKLKEVRWIGDSIFVPSWFLSSLFQLFSHKTKNQKSR